MTLTDRVRKEIPKILINHSNGLTFKELFKELKKVFGDELVNKIGEDRVGILRGIINRLESKPIESVVTEKRGSNIYYVYISNPLNKLEVVIKNFLEDINNKKLLNVSVLEFSKDDRERFREYENLISKLHDAVISNN